MLIENTNNKQLNLFHKYFKIYSGEDKSETRTLECVYVIIVSVQMNIYINNSIIPQNAITLPYGPEVFRPIWAGQLQTRVDCIELDIMFCLIQN